MRTLLKLVPAYLLACVLTLTLFACAPHNAEVRVLPASAPVPARTEEPAVPTEQAPTGEAPASGNSSEPAVTHDQPVSTGDIPAMYPDEETTLTYMVGEEEVTAPALRHYTLHGYSIVYDVENYVCNAFPEGDNYWASEGNYLSVSLIFGMPIEDVLAGLRLQENIAMEPEPVTVGAKGYPAQTLYLTTPAGLYRQFWAMDCAGDVLLVEQSYDTFSSNAEVLRASQLAMLDTITILY